MAAVYYMKNLKAIKIVMTQKKIFKRVYMILATSFCKYISEVDEFIHLLVLIFSREAFCVWLVSVKQSLLQQQGN